jgi:hypothetical protein
MHQPMVFSENDELKGNLEKMLVSDDSKDQWDARLMARAYRNPAYWAKTLAIEGKHQKVAVDFSGILLENLAKLSQVQQEDADGNPIREIIPLWKEVLSEFPDSVEFAGTAYAHCYFPVTPEEDWGLQIDFWRKVASSLFGSVSMEQVKGFWLPEMGIPSSERLGRLVGLLRDRRYEWLILPIEAVRGQKGLSHEKRVEIWTQPHILSTDGGNITVIFRPRYDFIDQQAGCDANGIYQKCVYASRICENAGRKSPALVVPASDGENGNVIMNRFFPDTFMPFAREKLDDKVSSMTVTQYLKDYPPSDEIELEISGSSWLGSHSQWEAGDERLEMKRKIEQLSDKFHSQQEKTLKEDAVKALLMAETSCYVYWNSSFWLDQGKRMIDFAYQKLRKDD